MSLRLPFCMYNISLITPLLVLVVVLRVPQTFQHLADSPEKTVKIQIAT